VPHIEREEFSRHDPVHVTLRLQQGVGYLRDQRRTRLIEGALRQARERFGVRVVHYSIQGAHLHLIVEAEGAAALSKAMQGLCIRLARGLNRLCGQRRGPVFVDRYHAHVLWSRNEAANAVRYVLSNWRHHVREHEFLGPVDPCSSAVWGFSPDAPRVEPRTWKLRQRFTPTGQETPVPPRPQ
jgi:REP element-mobilizing transposase RayT